MSAISMLGGAMHKARNAVFPFALYVAKELVPKVFSLVISPARRPDARSDGTVYGHLRFHHDQWCYHVV